MQMGVGGWLPFRIDMGFKLRVQSSRYFPPKILRKMMVGGGFCCPLFLSTYSSCPITGRGKNGNTKKESLGFEPLRGTKHKSGVGRAIMTHYLVCLRTWTPTPCGLV